MQPLLDLCCVGGPGGGGWWRKGRGVVQELGTAGTGGGGGSGRVPIAPNGGGNQVLVVMVDRVLLLLDIKLVQFKHTAKSNWWCYYLLVVIK